MATEDDPVPVYTAEDGVDGINVLSAESLYRHDLDPATESTLAQELQQPQSHHPLTRYPEALLHPAAIFLGAKHKTTTSKNAIWVPISEVAGDKQAHQRQQKQAQRQADEHNAQIIDSFYDAVRSKNVEVVTRLINSGVVSPNVSDDIGSTPLIVAADVGDVTMVRCLLQLGAEIDVLAAYDDEEHTRPPASSGLLQSQSQSRLTPIHLAGDAVRRNRGRLYLRHTSGRALPLRTALQVAATRGNIVIVKLLLTNEFGGSGPADDAIVAPDGQIALRLAAANGHREVVDALPSRRGGEFLRWKTTHSAALGRIRRAGKKLVDFFIVIFWEIPRFFVWTCPKHVLVRPLVEIGKYSWRHRAKLPAWCKRQVTKMPQRARRLGSACKHVAKRVGHGVTRLPSYIRDLAGALCRFLKRLPPACRIVGVYLATALRAAGQHALHILGRLVSVIHTALLALARFLRGVTARDFVRGLKVLLYAVFVSFPRDVLFENCILGAARAGRDVLETLFGLLGRVAGWLGLGVMWLIAYVPRQVGRIFGAIGESGGKAVHELLVWVDPKR